MTIFMIRIALGWVLCNTQTMPSRALSQGNIRIRPRDYTDIAECIEDETHQYSRHGLSGLYYSGAVCQLARGSRAVCTPCANRLTNQNAALHAHIRCSWYFTGFPAFYLDLWCSSMNIYLSVLSICMASMIQVYTDHSILP